VLAILLNAITLGALLILVAAAVSALREGIAQKARPSGLLVAAAVLLGSGLLLWAVLV
jgi:hypothetical protein